MTTDLEKQFFDTFGIEPKLNRPCEQLLQNKYCNENSGTRDTYFDPYPYCVGFENCAKDYKERVWVYPKITDRILLGLEEIFAHNKINSTGFFNGFHVEKHNDYWIYQLTYYKGGYYTCGFGKTRKEAFLNQLITILNDKEVEEKEKQLIKQQVQALFKEVE